MLKIYEEIKNKVSEGVYINYYESVEDVIADGVDEDSFDEGFYVYGNKEIKPSELNEPFILVELDGATDLPIFTKERKSEIVRYLKDSGYIGEGN